MNKRGENLVDWLQDNIYLIFSIFSLFVLLFWGLNKFINPVKVKNSSVTISEKKTLPNNLDKLLFSLEKINNIKSKLK